jgi:hypothetical protein
MGSDRVLFLSEKEIPPAQAQSKKTTFPNAQIRNERLPEY